MSYTYYYILYFFSLKQLPSPPPPPQKKKRRKKEEKPSLWLSSVPLCLDCTYILPAETVPFCNNPNSWVFPPQSHNTHKNLKPTLCVCLTDYKPQTWAPVLIFSHSEHGPRERPNHKQHKVNGDKNHIPIVENINTDLARSTKRHTPVTVCAKTRKGLVQFV